MEAPGGSQFAVSHNKSVLLIKRGLPGLSGKKVEMELIWNDNMQDNGNFMGFYVHGDSGPGRWFSIVYMAGWKPGESTIVAYLKKPKYNFKIHMQNKTDALKLTGILVLLYGFIVLSGMLYLPRL